jgi:hypothetical protein
METPKKKSRVYGGCEKETDAGRCNKPVKLAGQKGPIRCADHPVKRLWPEDDDDGVAAAVRADAESASLEELEAASDILKREAH